ncbi:hypothetical protein AXF42_Ash009866 [Apostasia shenzhenica]|uniref:Uncharacterized protein n=1 Tax=Apostasia shenzhenica TaxID=1088818 RepID=A0A2I0AC92_9ASPA|nr:hypothetical protein AXF42_Ash009866 [Apostasia shenzhenica]
MEDRDLVVIIFLTSRGTVSRQWLAEWLHHGSGEERRLESQRWPELVESRPTKVVDSEATAGSAVRLKTASNREIIPRRGEKMAFNSAE